MEISVQYISTSLCAIQGEQLCLMVNTGYNNKTTKNVTKTIAQFVLNFLSLFLLTEQNFSHFRYSKQKALQWNVCVFRNITYTV